MRNSKAKKLKKEIYSNNPESVGYKVVNASNVIGHAGTVVRENKRRLYQQAKARG